MPQNSENPLENVARISKNAIQGRSDDNEGEADAEAVAAERTGGTSSSAATTITAALWDQLMALEGQTTETPKGEPFRVTAVTRGEHVTVSPLDGAQEWDV